MLYAESMLALQESAARKKLARKKLGEMTKLTGQSEIIL